MDDSAKCRYDTILGRNILTSFRLNIKSSEHVIEADDKPLKVSTASMVDFGTYEFKKNTGEITHEELFMNAYAEEINESE